MFRFQLVRRKLDRRPIRLRWCDPCIKASLQALKKEISFHIQVAARPLRDSIRRGFRRAGISKDTKTVQALGCSFDEARAHLERLFWPGMTWGNHGTGWHIDHIMPLSAARTREELLLLCHYTNLQPLWADDNLRKKDRLDWTPTSSSHELPERLKKLYGDPAKAA